MTDDDKSAKSRFKSKWAKVFKESDSPTANSPLKLNEDVADFLKPSTDKAAARPKIDTALATRFPDAVNQIRSAHGSALGERAWIPLKPRRREGLSVGFVRTEPEVMGEGGDESLDPPSEILRRRIAVARSKSEAKPHASAGAQQWPAGSVPSQNPGQAMLPRAAPAVAPQQKESTHSPPRRANTSYNEFSPPMQSRMAPPRPPSDGPPPEWKLNRAPTGFSAEDDSDEYDSSPRDMPRHQQMTLSKTRPMLETKFDFENDSDTQNSAVTWTLTPQIAIAQQEDSRAQSPRSPLYAASLPKRRSMRANEGAALRRLSGMNFMGKDEDIDVDPEITRLQDSGYLNPERSAPQPKPPPGHNLAPQTAVSSSSHMAMDSRYAANGSQSGRLGAPPSPTPDTSAQRAASPFDDPKYINRHSREMSSNAPLAREMPMRERTEDQSRMDPLSTSISVQPTNPPETMPQASDYNRKNFSRPQQPTGYPNHSQGQASLQDQAQQPDFATKPLRNTDRSPTRARQFQSGLPLSEGQNLSLFPTQSSGTASSMHQLPTQSSQSVHSSRENANLRKDSNFSATSSAQSRNGLQQQQPYPQQSPRDSSPRSSLLGKPSASPYARNPSPADYFSPSRQAPPSQAGRSPIGNFRAREAERPGSAASSHGSDSYQRPPPSPLPTSATEANAAAVASLADFSARVAHMKGVFRLTAEKENPGNYCTPIMWLRTAIWWFLRGRFGLDEMLRQRQRQSVEMQSRELLTQAHVDLAKAWWILYDQLGLDEMIEDSSLPAPQPGESFELAQAKRSGLLLRSHLRSVCLAMGNKRVMPPHQSLIQGQDMRIWLEYPRFTPDAAAVLSGKLSRASIMVDSLNTTQRSDPVEFLPFADSRDSFCYGRFAADAFINTDEADTDRVVLPCVISMTRGRRDYQSSIIVASQTELVNLKVSPGESEGLSWHDVSWKASANGMTLRLPRGFDLSLRLSERDFRSLWNLVEYTRKVNHSLKPEQDERPALETNLVEVQYADSSNPNAFPQGSVRDCRISLFEKSDKVGFGGELRTIHRGFRLLLVTSSGHKTLSSVAHELCKSSPVFFEFRTDPTALGVALILKIRENSGRQCRLLLVFGSDADRQDFFDVLNGMDVGHDETIVTKLSLVGMNIEPATQTEGFSPVPHPALQQLSWHQLGVTNMATDDPTLRVPPTVLSTSLRVVTRHNGGCITDRMNLGKGELLLRLPCVDHPTIQFLRQPQEDITMSIDSRHSPPNVVDATTELHHMVHEQPTIRTFTFNTPSELHEFQLAVTGMSVKYDGLAATFGIARRRMVVPIYKKWEATKVRMQIVANAQNTVTQVLAFMEDFSHADAMVFQVKKTDDFESSKGDSKAGGKKWGVKLKDAKFSLPKEAAGAGKAEIGIEEKVGLRFVNLEGMDYMEEHDDITVGFDTEEQRDRFAQALPAATTMGRGLTLKRRI